MIRVVLAVLLGAALFGIALPVAEHADRDRSASLAIGELERLDATAERLVATNDPVEPPNSPPAVAFVLEPPDSTFADPGHFRLTKEQLKWVTPEGHTRSVEPATSVRIDTPTILAERTRLRLSFVRTDDEPVVRIREDLTRV